MFMFVVIGQQLWQLSCLHPAVIKLIMNNHKHNSITDVKFSSNLSDVNKLVINNYFIDAFRVTRRVCSWTTPSTQFVTYNCSSVSLCLAPFCDHKEWHCVLTSTIRGWILQQLEYFLTKHRLQNAILCWTTPLENKPFWRRYYTCTEGSNKLLLGDCKENATSADTKKALL